MVTAERPDRDDEICHFASTRPYYEDLREEFSKATDGKSIAPLREMHQLSAVGVGKNIDFDTDAKIISMGFKVVDDNAWKKVLEGVYTGFSQGGSYVKTWRGLWTDPTTQKTQEYTYYTAKPGEISLVDSPCLKDARFQIVKADGTTEMRKFVKATPPDPKPGAVVPGPYGDTTLGGEKIPVDPTATTEMKCAKCGKAFKGASGDTLCAACKAEIVGGSMAEKAAAAAVKALLVSKAKQPADLTNEERGRVLRNAVTDKYSTAPRDLGAPSSGTYAWVRDFTDDYVIVDYGDKTWKVPYTLADNGEVTFAEPVEVRQQYVEVGKVEKRKRRCPECGAELDDDDERCPECDADVDDLEDAAHGGGLKKDAKTKRVGDKDLPASAFAYVGDRTDPSTWKYPVHDANHARNALARWGQHKGIPAAQEAAVLARIKRAAKKFGIEVSDEAGKLLRAVQFLTDPLGVQKAGLWKAEQLQEVVQTVTTLQAAAQEDGGPEDLPTLLDHALKAVTSLVTEENRELQDQAASLAAKGDKTMTPEELQKAADDLLAKARSVGDHLNGLKALHTAFHAKATMLHKGHLDGACAAIDKALKAAGATSVTSGDIGTGRSDAPASASVSVDATQGNYPGSPHPNEKSLTLEDVAKLVNEGVEKAVQKANEANLDTMMKIAVALAGGDPMASVQGEPAGGIGDRNQVVKTGIQQTLPAGPKEGDVNKDNTAVVPAADVKKALGQGDPTELLKMARSIKSSPVPSHLMGGDGVLAKMGGGR
jgi:hypothetical protein